MHETHASVQVLDHAPESCEPVAGADACNLRSTTPIVVEVLAQVVLVPDVVYAACKVECRPKQGLAKVVQLFFRGEGSFLSFRSLLEIEQSPRVDAGPRRADGGDH